MRWSEAVERTRAAAETRPRPGALGGQVADRVVPALCFAGAAGARAAGLVHEALRWPGGADVPARLLHLLGLVEGALAVLFCATIATLMLERRAPRGERAAPPAVALALAGTLMMNAVVVQPAATGDIRVLLAANALLAAGLALCVYAAASLGRCFGVAAEARGVVTTGAYRLVRHPLYVGETIAALGALLAALSPATVLVFAAFCACQAARAALEERALLAALPGYARYRRRTPALLPRPRQGKTTRPHCPPERA